MRTVVVHYHLFKNAGTTMDGILAKNFPDEAHGHIEGNYPWSTVSSQQVLDYARANSQLRAISSHQARLPLPQDPTIRFVPILFIRHPIDRFASVYEFERRQPADSLSPSVSIARNGGLAAFADWVVSREATAVCRNFHVIHLAGAQDDMRTARATHADYELALSRLDDLPFFGIVDRFESSLEQFERVAEPLLGKLDFNYVSDNVTPGRHATLDERLAAVEAELGVSLYRELLECNALDMLLYREALARFEKVEKSAINTSLQVTNGRTFSSRLINAIKRK
ncbi:sulfotransferase family 2 domain-containing protein [Paraburkholderia sp. C35]|uniref:sulfotransferase family 2 domain-containing protein n=1 Tax=Paraburkholderia sp. C35 TaxID=2126993 RepID=UPI000D69E488|nr:sulfotransferase family 2 domain-containing protein [Paraburkholderia sp. C35]